jgi:hypothetical protein
MKKAMFYLSVSLFLTACIHSSDSTQSSALESIEAELSGALSQRALKDIKHVVRTDLQFQKGCREENVEIEICDFRNSLLVDFERFSCEWDGERKVVMADWKPRKSVVLCRYLVNLTWPDGRERQLDVKSETYEYGIVFMDELVVEHGWKKRLDSNRH